ncbi:MAG: hypothetical protein HDT43_09565 [Ruminococcaceae bacterium]|nr:hypothetical protein [Oscillospiraceae bacterium]
MIRNVQSTTAVATASSKPSEYNFGKTTYIVNSIFADNSSKDLEHIVERLVLNEVEENEKNFAA